MESANLFYLLIVDRGDLDTADSAEAPVVLVAAVFSAPVVGALVHGHSCVCGCNSIGIDRKVRVATDLDRGTDLLCADIVRVEMEIHVSPSPARSEAGDRQLVLKHCTLRRRPLQSGVGDRAGLSPTVADDNVGAVTIAHCVPIIDWLGDGIGTGRDGQRIGAVQIIRTR